MNVKEKLLYNYSRLRSLNFFLQYNALNSLGRMVPFVDVRRARHSPRQLLGLLREIDGLLRADAENIAHGVYPLEVLKPESFARHACRVPRVLFDGLSIGLRRRLKKTKSFDVANEELFKDLPEYYRRNFHFQTDGYLSDDSADLYEHQVELLFSGTADPMRRLLLPPARAFFASGGGRRERNSPLRFLELGCGVGSMTRFMRATFRNAEITAIDLSKPYLAAARSRFSKDGPNFQFADAARLPFEAGEFDFVYSVFLFHELPGDVRKQVITEARRVLREDGAFGFVDSLQLGDNADFDRVLKRFPVDFHEPFFADYISEPMSALVGEAGFTSVNEGRGFLSKFGVYGV